MYVRVACSAVQAFRCTKDASHAAPQHRWLNESCTHKVSMGLQRSLAPMHAAI